MVSWSTSTLANIMVSWFVFVTSLSVLPYHGRFVSSLSSSPMMSSSTKPVASVTESKLKRIAIVGAGAVGSYYGGRIWESVRTQSDVNVMFHLRNEHYDHCSQHGIEISSYHGDFCIPPDELLAFPTTEEMAQSVVASRHDGRNDGGIFDWVICALKSTSVSSRSDHFLSLKKIIIMCSPL